jgi:hypothetical protein
VRGKASQRNDPPLSPAIRAYLADFTRFILEGKSTGDEDAHAQAARDKAASFSAVLDEACVVPERRARTGPRHVRRAA